MSPVIEIRGLTKSFGPVAAVDNLDLRVEKGEIYGFLGRNGAGKTTTIRMLLGMIRPDAGCIRLLGAPVSPDRGPWNRVGSLVESAVAWPDLTVVQNLRTLADLHGLGRNSLDQVLAQLELTDLADRRAQNLSLGNLQRLALSMALLPGPELLILDEPVNGLDPAGVVQIRELLVGLARDQGCTIFVSSHMLDEVVRTCSRIGILHQGHLVQELDTADLARLSTHRLVLKTSDPLAAQVALARGGITALAGKQPGDLVLDLEAPERVAPLLVAAGVPLLGLSVESEGLEDFFLRCTGGAT